MADKPEQQAAPPDEVSIHIDGVETRVPAGELLIKAAEDTGTYIPRFCWHPRMKPVGMCRMCLVEVETPRGKMLTTSCTTPVADGMVVDTESEVVTKAQEGILEFLLINHPLDCPVCDKGGECPLQDQAFAYGPGESRYVEAKRHFEKPVPISDIVYMDRERCILCARCTRFSDEVSGDPLIEFMSRGNYTEVITFPDEPFASYFSGNTVQICPVGALTAKPFRFKARPWDLEAVESVSLVDSVHSKISIQASQNQINRVYGIDNDATNHGWLSDKDRFIYEHVDSPDRLTEPLVRRDGELVPVSWSEALAIVADRLGAVPGTSIGAIGGARFTNEDNYAFSKFMRSVVVSAHLDAQLGDGLTPELAAAVASRAAIDDVDSAATIIVWASDLKESFPVLYLRVRKAVLEGGANLVVVHPRRTGLDAIADVVVRYRPGNASQGLKRLADEAGDLLSTGPVVALVGATGIGESSAVAETVAASVRKLPDSKIMPLEHRGNIFGALDMGVSPRLLPGRVPVTSESGRDRIEDSWGILPEGPGLDTTSMLEQLETGQLSTLILFGADPARDHPDPALAQRAMEAAEFVVSFDMFTGESTKHADVVLPVGGMAEVEGTVTNLEGRVQKVNRLVPPAGLARQPWSILDDLASEMGAYLGAISGEAIAKEIAEVAVAYTGVGWEALAWGEGKEGIVVPTEAAQDTLQYIPTEVAVSDTSDRFALHSGRVLYDDGTMLQHSASLAALQPEARLWMHPRDAAAIAATEGQTAIVGGSAAVELPVALDPSLEPGTVYVPAKLAASWPLGAPESVTIDVVRGTD